MFPAASSAVAEPTSLPLPPLRIVLRCPERVARKARYVFDSLLQAAGIPAEVVGVAPERGPWLLYAENGDCADANSEGLLFIPHDPKAWAYLDSDEALGAAITVDDQSVLFGTPAPRSTNAAGRVGFDLPANAFYVLSSWAERCDPVRTTRQLSADSVLARAGLPQDLVDRYLAHLVDRLRAVCVRQGWPVWPEPQWPGGKSFALVLSHDVDYLPVRPYVDNAVQGAKAVLRHLVRQRDPGDAWRAARGWVSAVLRGRDPYGCVPEIIERERALGVRSSFQIAVGHRHPADVNYHIDDDRVRDYLRAVQHAGFDLCLHGSYRSTEQAQWYQEEVELLASRLGRPAGSRQHFLSFDYDTLFEAQEAAGIRYDMSLGYPDRPGPRAGFSFPYFPYHLREDRPFRVLQISLFLMDVTLRGYMGLRPASAHDVIAACLSDLKRKRGGASAVWHPIVFGNARDPGYADLYFDMIGTVTGTNGWATDGRDVDAFWRSNARAYGSFAWA